MPVPDSGADSGLFGALEATVSVPLAAPAAVGANFTRPVRGAPAPSVPRQVLVGLNGPLTDSCEIEAEVEPGLDTVTVCAALVCPTVTLPNDTLDGDAVNGAGPPEELAKEMYRMFQPPLSWSSTRICWPARSVTAAVTLVHVCQPPGAGTLPGQDHPM